MRIKLTATLPVEQKHGMILGRELDVLDTSPNAHGLRGYWVMGDAGEKVFVLARECVEI